MKGFYQRISLLLLILILIVPTVFAAPTPAPAVVNKVRFSQTPETIRIVFDMDKLPAYKVTLSENPAKLLIEFDGILDKAVNTVIPIKDSAVTGVKLNSRSPGKVTAAIDLTTAVQYKAFALKAPNRLVLDLVKVYEQKLVEQVGPGLKLTTLMRGRQDGALLAHILDIDPSAGYVLKPVLSNDAIVNLETVKSMADRTQAIAAVNASYFALSGDILGLTKIDGTIVSTAGLSRTAMGISKEGKVMIGQADYDGTVILSDGKKVAIAGVNCERGANNLVLYNRYYDGATDTNPYGTEYTIINDTVTAINPNNSSIPADGVVLSAHGTAAQSLAALKVGDKVKIIETLGPVWDQSVHVLGVGPTLIKNNGVYLSTKVEEFGPDVASGRAPRTALGLTKDGHILLAVVDGRQYCSAGFTLLELALFMQEAGAIEAMNFDGGGSSEMVVSGNVVNKPSDLRERRVGSALVVLPKVPIKLAN
ncbi:AMIN domain-containing protein [bacterium BFN5]|nr:AMIN domain-containing protein [bacterium BFN5]QJW46009.1 AMIN domain-containing protein [bacterium BFN5]